MDGFIKWLGLAVADFAFEKYLQWLVDSGKKDADRILNDPERRADFERSLQDPNHPFHPHNWRNAPNLIP